MISVLSVNYRSGSDLAGLAESIAAHQGGDPVELVVTNNSPEERLTVPSYSTLPILILPSANIGYAAGINLAFRHSRGDIILIANPDLRIGPRCLDLAATFLRENPQVGLVLPLLRDASGRVQASVRRFYTWPTVLYARSPLRWLGWKPAFFRRYLGEGLACGGPTPVDWGLGGAMFLRRRDCGDGEIFDERFFLYFEDVDLCYRLWSRGLRVMYCPQCECLHAHRRTSRNPLSKAGYHHFRSLCAFILKYRGLPRRPEQPPER